MAAPENEFICATCSQPILGLVVVHTTKAAACVITKCAEC